MNIIHIYAKYEATKGRQLFFFRLKFNVHHSTFYVLWIHQATEKKCSTNERERMNVETDKTNGSILQCYLERNVTFNRITKTENRHENFKATERYTENDVNLLHELLLC